MCARRIWTGVCVSVRDEWYAVLLSPSGRGAGVEGGSERVLTSDNGRRVDAIEVGPFGRPETAESPTLPPSPPAPLPEGEGSKRVRPCRQRLGRLRDSPANRSQVSHRRLFVHAYFLG